MCAHLRAVLQVGPDAVRADGGVEDAQHQQS
jgi:hypothetical protein